MTELCELAAEYRMEAARLAARIDALRSEGADRQRIARLERMLADVRLTARTLAGYYDEPRPGEIDASSWRGRRASRDDH